MLNKVCKDTSSGLLAALTAHLLLKEKALEENTSFINIRLPFVGKLSAKHSRRERMNCLSAMFSPGTE